MNPAPPSPPPDPAALLRHGLRDTTPAFEQRWTALRRQLRHEPAPRRARLLPWLWAVLAPAALAAAWLLLSPRVPHLRPASGSADLAAFADLLSLDADLRPALPLADGEIVDDLLAIPSRSPDQT